MAKFSSEKKGTWFYYDPDKPEAGGLCLRLPTEDEKRHIERLTVKHNWKFERGTGRRYDDLKEDEKLAEKLRLDIMIVDWKETYLDGQMLECTKENKVKIMNVSADFAKFWGESFDELSRQNVTLEEARVKNLEPSPSGSTE